jgi:DNA processing protein
MLMAPLRGALHIQSTKKRADVPDSRPPISDLAAGLSLLLEREDRRTIRAALARAEVDVAGLLQRARIKARRATLGTAGVGALALGDVEFPELLAAIPDPPVLLYHRGELACLRGAAIAIVGARRASSVALDFARGLAADLAGAGVVIVSGLALGMDAAAHSGALAARGSTVAVLGSGVDRITPLANSALGEQILENQGLILSEYPPGTPAAAYRFPERNRLISGLALGVVVVEAGERSGSLITARLAAEQGREVMAVPALPGYPNSAGSNRLLKQGAVLVERAEDVLYAVGHQGGPGRPVERTADASGLTLEQQVLLDALDGRAQALDELAPRCGMAGPACAIALTELELAGFVQRVSGGYIRRPSEF